MKIQYEIGDLVLCADAEFTVKQVDGDSAILASENGDRLYRRFPGLEPTRETIDAASYIVHVKKDK